MKNKTLKHIRKSSSNLELWTDLVRLKEKMRDAKFSEEVSLLELMIDTIGKKIRLEETNKVPSTISQLPLKTAPDKTGGASR